MAERLFIMRHGEAAPGRPDASRRLTAQGRREAARMAGWLAGRSGRVDWRLVASPYVRARETADILAETLGGVPEILPVLTPEDPPALVFDWLLAEPDDIPMLLVSHMPLVGALVGLLTEGRTDRGPRFSTAAVAELEAEVRAVGAARLLAVTAPEDLV